jgi:hypothetical protein
MADNKSKTDDALIIDQADQLNEQVKALALNLALYLAKAKSDSPKINRLEPEFVRLVNGTVKVVQELTVVISAARNPETATFAPPTSPPGVDSLELKLRSILDQCQRIMSALSATDKIDEPLG